VRGSGTDFVYDKIFAISYSQVCRFKGLSV